MNTTISRQRDTLHKYGFDAILSCSKENVAYGIGYEMPSQRSSNRDRFFATIVDCQDHAALLLTDNEMPEARERSEIQQFLPYDEFNDDPVAVLADELKDQGLSKATVAIELSALDANRWERLKGAMPKVHWKDATELFEDARSIKTASEIASLQRAAKIAEAAQEQAHAQCTAGATERDVYRTIADAALREGADEIAMVQVGSGERSTYSNPSPSDRILRQGDIVKVDTFVKVSGYLSDTGRSFCVGSPSARQESIWGRMQEVLGELESMIKPGASTRRIWQHFTRRYEELGLKPAMRFLGHGLGLSLHEPPYLADHTDRELVAGMVLAIEPVYNDGPDGYHLEDNLLVTDSGCTVFTDRFPNSLISIPA